MAQANPSDKQISRSPDEQFLETAARDGRCKLQDFSMKAIGTPDVSFQARAVHLDLNHVNRLSRAKREHGSLSPVILFIDDKLTLLADGHHRHEVYRKDGETTIPAYVVECSPTMIRQEAIEYATMCNREMCLGRTRDDINKAVAMLLKTETWWNRSDTWISHHVGCATITVIRIRSLVSKEENRPMPARVLGANEIDRPYKKPDPNSPLRTISAQPGRTNTKYAARYQGQKITGATPSEVQDKIDLAHLVHTERQKSTSSTAIHAILFRHGFSSVYSLGENCTKGGYAGLNGVWRDDLICVSCDFATAEALPLACGQLIAARQKSCYSDIRMIVVCNVEDCKQAEALDLFVEAGFEFLTTDEVVGQIKTNGRATKV